jgi:spore coat polysaccharide biosynthesis predicted glycosyltransferase SpsG
MNFPRALLVAEIGFHHNGDMALPERMITSAREAGADATTAGASASWEGLPALMLVPSKDQETVAWSLQQRGAVQNLGWGERFSPGHRSAAIQPLAQDPGLRHKMVAEERLLFDGLGSRRVTEALRGETS